MGKDCDGNPTKYIGIIHRLRRSGTDFVLRCTRITVRQSSVTMNAATSTTQNNVEQERQATILLRLMPRGFNSVGSEE
jgi:hypothetical protein